MASPTSKLETETTKLDWGNLLEPRLDPRHSANKIDLGIGFVKWRPVPRPFFTSNRFMARSVTVPIRLTRSSVTGVEALWLFERRRKVGEVGRFITCQRDPTTYPGPQYSIHLNSAVRLSQGAEQTFSRAMIGGVRFLTHPSIPQKYNRTFRL